MEKHRVFIERLIQHDGPHESDYPELDAFIQHLHRAVSDGGITPSELADIRSWFGSALSTSTMQGFALAKPHGYAGDFELIDRFYQSYVSPDPQLAAWDRYAQRHAGAQAVRNRKTYFRDLLLRHAHPDRPIAVLNLASGPGRDVFEFFSHHPHLPVTFDCIEQDANAIRYATELCRPFLQHIAFTAANALRFRPSRRYDIIWSAGLFDYFGDATFVRLLSRLAPALAPGGELVVGNFSEQNPSRSYMEFFEWSLQHRSAAQLLQLAERAGFSSTQLTIGSEPQGVNLFLHVAG